MSVHQSRPLTAAVVALLEAADLIVAAGHQPAAGGWQATPANSTFKPYVVVWPLSGDLDGSIAVGHEDAQVIYQLSCVGASIEQAEWTADTARTALLTGPLALTGRSAPLVTIEELGGAMRDDKTQPPVWWIADRYSILTTPTT